VQALGRLTERALSLAAVLLLLGLLAAVVTGVAARQLNRPVAWSDELAQHLLVWTGFVGWMIAGRRRAHIRIGAVVDRLPPPLRVPLEVVIRLVVIAFAGALLWHGTPLVPRNWDISWVSLPLPSGLLYLPIPVAALAVAAQALAEIGRLVGLADDDGGPPP
jgi:TRAP-type C4-dicarboxylate transport system permease small subunit